MLTGILAILSSSAFGTILGAIAGIINRRVDIEGKKLDHAHEQARWGHDLKLRDKDIELANAEAQAKERVALIDSDAKLGVAQFAAMAEAYKADVGPGDWIDMFRRLIRPASTTILLVAALIVNFTLLYLMIDVWPTLAVDQRKDLILGSLAWVTGQSSATLGWWYTTRSTAIRG